MAQDGRGGAIFAVGEAGIGRSRLAAAAADLGFTTGMRVMRGRGSAIGPRVPFRSLTEALLSLPRSGQAIDTAALGPYRRVLARLVPDWGVPPPGEDRGSLVVLAEGVLRLTALAGGRGGSLLILDDLQDSDAETLAVVEYLTDNLVTQPTVLVATIRADPSPALDLARAVAQRGSGVVLALHRLGELSVRELVASCLGCDPHDVPAQVAEYAWMGSAGNPLVAEELLQEMLSSGLLVREATSWRVTGGLRRRIPATLARTIGGQLDLVGPPGRELLSLAAVLGQRFPVALLQAALGTPHRDLLSLLQSDVARQFVAPDEETPDWFTFQHSLIAEVLLSLLPAERRRELAARAADAVEATYPGVPGEWCQTAASLWIEAGDPARAGRLFAEAGHRAFHQGAATTAVTLLDKALGLLTSDADAQIRVDAFATQLYALVEAGQVARAMTSAAQLDQVASALDRRSRARLHTRSAWVAMVGGRSAEGLAQVDIARRLLGPEALGHDTAPVDIVEAHLMLDTPGPHRVREAERLARRAAAAAAHEPMVVCQAWQLLAALTRSRNPERATACLEQARRLAVQYGLQIEEIHALIRLGNDDALRDGGLDRLEQVCVRATEVGAVTTRYQAEAGIALQAILRADFNTAEELLDQVLLATMRLRLLEITRYALLLRAILAAHRARRRDMDAAFAELRRWEGNHDQHTPCAYGLARAWCALLEENRSQAERDLSLALAAESKRPMTFQLTGRYGLNLLLRVLDRKADLAEYNAIAAHPAGRVRWDRQFAVFAKAVLAGQAGRKEEAARTVNDAIQLAALYPTARHIGLRLVSEAAIVDDWGTPTVWLQAAEEYFHHSGIPAVSSACRALLRRTGAPVAQRRQGVEEIPHSLRSVGITVREYQTLCLITGRLSNREIAARLHLSPRTVEKHVASLLAKTGQPDRIALADFAAAMVR